MPIATVQPVSDRLRRLRGALPVSTQGLALDPTGEEVLGAGAGGSAGFWIPQTNGDPDDPSVLFALNADGAPIVVLAWET